MDSRTLPSIPIPSLQGLLIHFLQLVNRVLIFALAHGQVGAAQRPDWVEDGYGG